MPINYVINGDTLEVLYTGSFIDACDFIKNNCQLNSNITITNIAPANYIVKQCENIICKTNKIQDMLEVIKNNRIKGNLTLESNDWEGVFYINTLGTILFNGKVNTYANVMYNKLLNLFKIKLTASGY